MNQLWVRFSLVIALVVVLINVFPAVVRGVFPPPQRPEFRENLPEEVREQIPQERFERYEESVSERIWESTWRSAIVGSAFGLLFGVGLSRTMVKPLLELEKGAKAVATHNLSYRVKEEGSSEIQAVARAFNEMASELEQSETLRRNLLADVTHELRHPVHVLRGNLQGILDGIFPLELEEVVALMEQTEQLTQLVNDLHDIALAEAHELPMHPQTISLSKLVKDVVETMHILAAEKEIALSSELPEGELWINAHPGRIRQVLHNLVANAIQYTPAGGQVRVKLAVDTSGISLFVTDSGIGLTAEELPHVFNRFYRADASRSRHERGTGLGLAIAKAIVEAHGGQLTVTSPGPQQGSTFALTLPLSRQVVEPD